MENTTNEKPIQKQDQTPVEDNQQQQKKQIPAPIPEKSAWNVAEKTPEKTDSTVASAGKKKLVFSR